MTYVEIKKYSTTYLYNKDNLPLVAVDDVTGLPYYLKLNGKEIYPDGPVILNQQYAKDENKLPYYPKDKTNKEIYIKDADVKNIYIYRNKSPVYALDRGKPYYATDIENSEFYPVDEKGNEIYMTIDGKQIYAHTVDNIELYAKNKKTDGSDFEVYALNGKIPYYASTLEGEFYAFDENEIYIAVDGKQIYATYKHGGQRYAFRNTDDGNSTQYYATNRGLAYYAIDDKKSQYYVDTGTYIEIDRKQIYAKDVDENERYTTFMNIEIFARDHGKPYYAKRKNKAEFYPLKRGAPYYVHDDERSLYAKNEKQSQFYIKVKGKEIYGKNVKTKNQLYALDTDLHQFYATDRGKPYFAKLGNGDPYYPQNSKGQDFYFALARDRNGKTILPNRDMVTFVKNPTIIVMYSDFLKNIQRPKWSLSIIVAIFTVLFTILIYFLFKSR